MTERARRRNDEQWMVVGTGFIGSALAAALERGSVPHRIMHAPRVSLQVAATVSETVAVLSDAPNEHEVGNLAAAFAGAAVVVNAAGLAAPGAAASAQLSGANGLLPSLLYAAAVRAGVRCVIHLSSAAVQGRTRLLTESERKRPESAYGRSKALGEDAVLSLSRADPGKKTQLRILRAKWVLGTERSTSSALTRIARSRLSSVAGNGSRPSPVSSIYGLTSAIMALADADDAPSIVLQPWDGLTARAVLEQFGAKRPLLLPAPLCRAALWAGYVVSRWLRHRFTADVRRLEVMWFGQRQVPGWLVTSATLRPPQAVRGDAPTVIFGATAALTARVFMLEQCRYLSRHGWNVHLVSAGGVDRNPVAEFAWHTIEMHRRISLRDDLLSILEWIRLVRRLRPQVVMVGTPKAGLLGTMAAYVCRVPVRVYLIRGLRAEGLTGRTRTLSLLSERLTCRLATHIVAVGEDLKARIAEEGLAARERIDVIGHGGSNGVDATQFRPPETENERIALRRQLAFDDKIVIGFVGRLTLGKGIEDALAAVQALNTERDRARLLMVGEYEVENPVPSEIAAKLESPQVVRVGRVLDTAPYYRAMDIYLHLSRYEGLPNAVLEAGASGLPVITTDATGCPDAMSNGITGYVVPIGDVESLTARLEDLCDSRGQRRMMGDGGRRFVTSNFINEIVWSNLLCYLNWIVPMKRAGS